MICLQNDKDLGIFNGMLATVTRVRSAATEDFVILDFEDEVGEKLIAIPVATSQFGNEHRPEGRSPGISVFDYGTAMTIHKAQGSEWNNVAVLEEISSRWDSSRWRYTAVTRASKRLDYFLSAKRRPRYS